MTRAFRLSALAALTLGAASVAGAQDASDDLGSPLQPDAGLIEDGGFGGMDALRPGDGIGVGNVAGVPTPEVDELMEDFEGGASGLEQIGEGVGEGGGIVEMPEIDALDDDASDLGRTAIGEIDGGPGQIRTPEVGEVLDDLGGTGVGDAGIGVEPIGGAAGSGGALDM